MTGRTRGAIARRIFAESLARLADIAPAEMAVVLSEESDWGLVGGDLRDAIETLAPAPAPVATIEDDRKELVEA